MTSFVEPDFSSLRKQSFEKKEVPGRCTWSFSKSSSFGITEDKNYTTEQGKAKDGSNIHEILSQIHRKISKA